MALTPDISFPDEFEEESKPLKTYAFDFKTGRIGGMIDGREAIEQFIRKTIFTARFAHLIYSPDYGCELLELIGKDYTPGFMESEIIRTITEALIYDDRIESVYDFNVTIKDDSVDVFFRVDTVEGTLEISEVINGV
jgi:phage baseplate assembly protein W